MLAQVCRPHSLVHFETGILVYHLYLAIMSTYRPPFFAFFAPGFRGPAALIKSSMLLALLILVAGRLGGALGGPPTLLFDTERIMLGGRGPGGTPRLSLDAACASAGPGGPPGGALARPMGGVIVRGGGGVPVLDLEAPFGGGGVAVFACVASAPPFLFTQRFRSGSYTKLLDSPRLALTGLLPCWGSGLGSFLPPNQLPNPHPFLDCCCAATRLAIRC